jgi:hypothetical protein
MGCADLPTDPTGQTADEVREPIACPAIAILCVPGYHPKTVGVCRQVCVPDRGAECTTDGDCAIYCITTPCPVGRCTGGRCRLIEPRDPPRASGSTCTPRCAPGYHCSECRTINGSGFVCLPDGAVC